MMRMLIMHTPLHKDGVDTIIIRLGNIFLVSLPYVLTMMFLSCCPYGLATKHRNTLPSSFEETGFFDTCPLKLGTTVPFSYQVMLVGSRSLEHWNVAVCPTRSLAAEVVILIPIIIVMNKQSKSDDHELYPLRLVEALLYSGHT